ncbi:hypothetical protein FACS1894188_00720 [Clostridia bacterium]|nr:hypothetical protein FACS1894188_00720 [Clostridia bacterium]
MPNYDTKPTKTYKSKKPFQELNLEDNFMFAKVMSNTEILRKTLSLLLSKNIMKVEFVESEKTIENSPETKGSRLDVYATDENGEIYNIEMQTGRKDNIFKRSRYYQGNIDIGLLPKGAKYTSLRKTYIIFICTFDLFGKGRHIYPFGAYCKLDKTIFLDDGAERVFVNTRGTMEDVSPEVTQFLKYIENSTEEMTAGYDFLRNLHAEVQKIRSNKEMEMRYMTMPMREDDIRYETEIETRLEAAVDFIAEFGIQATKALRTLKLPEDMLSELRQLLDERGVKYQI